MYGATAGKVGLLNIEATTNQAVCSILPSELYEPYFLYYAIKSKEKWMISQTAGAAQPNISQTVIKKMALPLPPKNEQIRYANFVKQIDKSKFVQ